MQNQNIAFEEPSAPSNDGEFRLSVSNENFEAISFQVRDQVITGIQIAELVRKHPVEEFVVMRHLASGELESLRPSETSPLDSVTVNDFFVIQGSETFRFFVDGLVMEWPKPEINGLSVKRLARRDQDDVDLFLDRENVADQLIGDHQLVRIAERGLERFRIRDSHRGITIYVDGEAYEVSKRQQSPNEIIANLAKKDPSNHYLVQIGGGDQISYKDKGDEIIRLRNKSRFQVISIGPTTVSDVERTGKAVFASGLIRLGYTPVSLPSSVDHLVFDYRVETGRFKDRMVRIGVIVPVDFPMNPPSGPYVSPEIHALNPVGSHPSGGVHKEHAKGFDAEAGGGWQYWSRPFLDWKPGRDPVARYLSHIWKLWDSQ